MAYPDDSKQQDSKKSGLSIEALQTEMEHLSLNENDEDFSDIAPAYVGRSRRRFSYGLAYDDGHGNCMDDCGGFDPSWDCGDN